MNEGLRRTLAAGTVLVVTGITSWWVWPRPALVLRIERGGQGLIVDRWGHTSPLPETVFIGATGRTTRVRVENRDTTYQTLGIFGAAASSTRNFTVPLPGAYGGFCSAHPTSQQITYVVQ